MKHTRKVSKNSRVMQCKFRVVGVKHKRGAEELKGHTTQVLYDGCNKKGIEELKSHTMHALGGGLHVSIFLRRQI